MRELAISSSRERWERISGGSSRSERGGRVNFPGPLRKSRVSCFAGLRGFRGGGGGGREVIDDFRFAPRLPWGRLLGACARFLLLDGSPFCQLSVLAESAPGAHGGHPGRGAGLLQRDAGKSHEGDDKGGKKDQVGAGSPEVSGDVPNEEVACNAAGRSVGEDGVGEEEQIGEAHQGEGEEERAAEASGRVEMPFGDPHEAGQGKHESEKGKEVGPEAQQLNQEIGEVGSEAAEVIIIGSAGRGGVERAVLGVIGNETDNARHRQRHEGDADGLFDAGPSGCPPVAVACRCPREVLASACLGRIFLCSHVFSRLSRESGQSGNGPAVHAEVPELSAAGPPENQKDRRVSDQRRHEEARG